MTNTYTWPTREKWEAEQRRHAEALIETGCNHWDDLDWPTWSEDERAEAKELAPGVIAMIRRTCGRVERAMRQRYPEVAALARGPREADLDERQATSGACRHNYPTTEDIDRWYAAVDALEGDDRDTFEALTRLRDIRRSLRRRRNVYSDNPDLFERPTEAVWTFDWIWSDGYNRPQSAELDRLREMNTVAVRRWNEKNRAMGRRLLADLESGAAWEDQLAHRKFCDEYFARGPIVEVIRYPNET